MFTVLMLDAQTQSTLMESVKPVVKLLILGEKNSLSSLSCCCCLQPLQCEFKNVYVYINNCIHALYLCSMKELFLCVG